MKLWDIEVGEDIEINEIHCGSLCCIYCMSVRCPRGGWGGHFPGN